MFPSGKIDLIKGIGDSVPGEIKRLVIEAGGLQQVMRRTIGKATPERIGSNAAPGILHCKPRLNLKKIRISAQNQVQF